MFLRTLYDTLLRLDQSGELVPGLVTEWEWEDDSTLRLELRDDVTFTDGTPLDGHAVASNIERIRDDPSSRSTAYDTITDIEVGDDATVTIQFSTPTPQVLSDFTGPAGMVVSPAAIAAGNVEDNPIGSGGWIYDAASSQPGIQWTFQANPDYWDPASQGVEVIEIVLLEDTFARLNALKDGQIDLTVLDPTSAADARTSGFDIVSQAGQFVAIVFSAVTPEASESLSDPEVRRAMAMSIDREAIVDTILFGFGQPAVAPVADDAWYADDAIGADLTFDVDAAQTTLDASGRSDVAVKVPTIPPLQTLTTAVGGYLAEIGVTMEQELVDPTADRRAAGIGALLAEFPLENPAAIAEAFFGPDSPLNSYGYENAELNALVQEAKSTVDRDELAAIYQDILRILVDEALVVTVATQDSIAAHHDGVSGVAFIPGDNQPNPLGIRVSS